MSGVASVVAAYGVGSPLLWWLVTAAGIVLLVVSVFLLREPAGAGGPAAATDGDQPNDSPHSGEKAAEGGTDAPGRAEPPASPPS